MNDNYLANNIDDTWRNIDWDLFLRSHGRATMLAGRFNRLPGRNGINRCLNDAIGAEVGAEVEEISLGGIKNMLKRLGRDR